MIRPAKTISFAVYMKDGSFFSCQSQRIVPAQHLQSSLPFETLSERWTGSLSGKHLACR